MSLDTSGRPAPGTGTGRFDADGAAVDEPVEDDFGEEVLEVVGGMTAPPVWAVVDADPAGVATEAPPSTESPV
ncbi:MAG: hypothetical protein ACR2LJ_06160 [Acidimicrobiales bacterium]